MGILNNDTDSDAFLDNEEIVRTPIINKIIDLTSPDNTNHSAESQHTD